jgi:LmbE family N-acetylglucosaminyl deacetylase
MTRQLITHATPHPNHRQLRNAAIAATAIAIAIAAGGYGAIQTLGPHADPPQSATSAAIARAIPKTQAMQEMRDTVANLYGPATSTAPVSRARAMREMRHTVANLYGDGR